MKEERSTTTHRPRRLRAGNVLSLLALCAILVFAAGPLVWMAMSSLKPASDIFSSPPQVFPRHLTTEWYISLFAQTGAARWFLDSFEVASSTMVINIVVGLLAAQSVVRFKYFGRRLYLGILLASYLFPAILLLLPLYMVLLELHLVGTIGGIVAAHVILTLPFAIWMLRSFVLGVPVDLEEAAKVDGCTDFWAFVRVTLPLMRTGIIATGLFVFILSWNEYVLASVISNSSTTTLPVGIANFTSSLDVQWGQILALGTLVTVPVLVFFALLQRYFEKGITAGALKG
jgi:ABC-type glycerol-3-phosphate transport system permease component